MIKPLQYLLTIAIIALVFLSCQTENQLSYISVEDINPEKRTFKSLNSSTYDLGHRLLQPGFFDISEDFVFITDFKDYGIYKGKLDTNKINLNKIAGRKGSGPGEFEDISDIQVVENSILVSDESRARLNEFTLEGNFKKSFTGEKFNAHRFSASDLNQVVVLSILDGENVLSLVDAEKGIVKDRFLKKDKDLSPLVYEGKITSSGAGQIFYAGFSEPVLIGFSPQGDKLYSVDHVGSYSSITNYVILDLGDNSRSFRYSPTAEFYTTSMTYVNQLICILVKRGDEKYVDFYDSQDGNYQYSYLANPQAIELSEDGGSLYILNLTNPNTSIDRIRISKYDL